VDAPTLENRIFERQLTCTRSTTVVVAEVALVTEDCIQKLILMRMMSPSLTLVVKLYVQLVLRPSARSLVSFARQTRLLSFHCHYNRYSGLVASVLSLLSHLSVLTL
jgi:hypothetical protein